MKRGAVQSWGSHALISALLQPAVPFLHLQIPEMSQGARPGVRPPGLALGAHAAAILNLSFPCHVIT